MTAKGPNPEALGATPANERASYKYWWAETVRFSDLDSNGHVNNADYYNYTQSCRINFLQELSRKSELPGTWMVASASIDFLNQIHYPANVDVGVRVSKIGRSSLHLDQALFSGDTCVATAKFIMVHVAHETGAADPLTDRFRDLVLTGV